MTVPLGGASKTGWVQEAVLRNASVRCSVRCTMYDVRRTWYSVCEEDDVCERMSNRMYQGTCIRMYMRVRVCGYACVRVLLCVCPVWLCVCAYVVIYACVVMYVWVCGWSCICGWVCGYVCMSVLCMCVCVMYVCVMYVCVLGIGRADKYTITQYIKLCQRIVYIKDIHCTLYSVQCTLYNVQCALYMVHYTLYTVHYTLYNVYVQYIFRKVDIAYLVHSKLSCCPNLYSAVNRMTYTVRRTI